MVREFIRFFSLLDIIDMVKPARVSKGFHVFPVETPVEHQSIELFQVSKRQVSPSGSDCTVQPVMTITTYLCNYLHNYPLYLSAGQECKVLLD